MQQCCSKGNQETKSEENQRGTFIIKTIDLFPHLFSFSARGVGRKWAVCAEPTLTSILMLLGERRPLNSALLFHPTGAENILMKETLGKPSVESFVSFCLLAQLQFPLPLPFSV